MAGAPMESLIGMLERGTAFRRAREQEPRELAEQVARQALLDAQVQDIPNERAWQEEQRAQTRQGWEQEKARKPLTDLLNALALMQAREQMYGMISGTPQSMIKEAERGRKVKSEESALAEQVAQTALAQAQVEKAKEAASPEAKGRERLADFAKQTGAGLGGGRSFGEGAVLSGLAPEQVGALVDVWKNAKGYAPIPTPDVPDVTGAPQIGALLDVLRSGLTDQSLQSEWGRSFAPGAEIARENTQSLIEGRDARTDTLLGKTAPAAAAMALTKMRTDAARIGLKLSDARLANIMKKTQLLERELEGVVSPDVAARIAVQDRQMGLEREKLAWAKEKFEEEKGSSSASPTARLAFAKTMVSSVGNVLRMAIAKRTEIQMAYEGATDEAKRSTLKTTLDRLIREEAAAQQNYNDVISASGVVQLKNGRVVGFDKPTVPSYNDPGTLLPNPLQSYMGGVQPFTPEFLRQHKNTGMPRSGAPKNPPLRTANTQAKAQTKAAPKAKERSTTKFKYNPVTKRFE